MDNDNNSTTTTTTITTSTTANTNSNTNIINNNNYNNDSNDSNDKEDSVIDIHKLEKVLKDISKKYEHKTQFKQHSVATLDRIVESFLAIILDQSDSTTTINNNNSNSENKNYLNDNMLTVNDIYKTILDLDLEFLLPDGGVTKKCAIDTRLNEFFCQGGDNGDDDDDDYDDYKLTSGNTKN